MLLTAQLVQRQSDKKTGINTVLFRHEPGAPPEMDWSTPNLQLLTEVWPGVLQAEQIEIPRGGNLVLAYLDLAAPEDVPAAAVRDLLKALEASLEPTHHYKGLRVPRIAVRVSINSNAPGGQVDARSVFKSLRDHALKVLDSPTSYPPSKGATPLVAEVSRDTDSLHVTLTAESKERLKRQTGSGVRPGGLTIDDETASDAKQAYGELYPQFATALTGLSLDDLTVHGGLRMIDKANGTLLWEWPPTHRTPGICLSCHQHGTLVPLQGDKFRCARCGATQDTDGLWVATLT